MLTPYIKDKKVCDLVLVHLSSDKYKFKMQLLDDLVWLR